MNLLPVVIGFTLGVLFLIYLTRNKEDDTIIYTQTLSVGVIIGMWISVIIFYW